MKSVYYKARVNCIDMLNDRGFKIPPHLYITEQHFNLLYMRNTMDIVGIKDKRNKDVFIKFLESSKQFNKSVDRSSVFKSIALQYNLTETNLIIKVNAGDLRIIIIYNSEHGNKIHSKYEKEYMSHKYMEIFPIKKIKINPIKHIYQPEWMLITDQKLIQNIYDKYSASPKLFGSICIDDPINRYYAGRPAEDNKLANIYKIIRNNNNIFYRKVIINTMNK